MRKTVDKNEISSIMYDYYNNGRRDLIAPMWDENDNVSAIYIYDSLEEQQSHWHELKAAYESKLAHENKLNGKNVYIYEGLDDLDSTAVGYDDQLESNCYIKEELPGNAPANKRYNIGVQKQYCRFCGALIELNSTGYIGNISNLYICHDCYQNYYNKGGQ